MRALVAPRLACWRVSTSHYETLPCSFSMPARLPRQPQAGLAAGLAHLRGSADALGVEPLLALVALHPVAGRLRVVRLLAEAVQLRGSRGILLFYLPLLLHCPLSSRLLREVRHGSAVSPLKLEICRILHDTSPERPKLWHAPLQCFHCPQAPVARSELPFSIPSALPPAAK